MESLALSIEMQVGERRKEGRKKGRKEEEKKSNKKIVKIDNKNKIMAKINMTMSDSLTCPGVVAVVGVAFRDRTFPPSQVATVGH